MSETGLRIVFDGPPGPESGRFVECETPDGRSVNAGEWHERPDGLWELRIGHAPPMSETAFTPPTLAAANSPWAEVVLPYSQSRNDLYAEPVECRCPSPLFEGSDIAHLMKNKIRLAGYDDSNFFDRVHALPHEGSCRCGRRYRFQWWRDGVAFAFLPDARAALTKATGQ